MIKRNLSHEYLNLKNNVSINCEECSGLCCVALCFNKIDGFPENKEAGIPCKYLNHDFKCKVYSQLATKQLKGCRAYDCFGAGQQATQRWNDDGQWPTNSTIKANVFTSYATLRLLNQMMWYLLEVYTICDESEIEIIKGLIKQNCKFIELNRNILILKDLEDYRKEVNHYLKKFILNFTLDAEYKLDNKLQLGRDFSHLNFRRADLSMACLIASNLKYTTLIDTVFLGADLRDVNVSDTDLSNSLFLTQFQINTMIGNKHTILPNGLRMPFHWMNN